MSFGGIVDGILANTLYDSAKRIIKKYRDTYTDVFDDSINEMTPKHPKLTKVHIDSFLYESPAENLMKNYIEHPENYINSSEKKLFSEKLIEEFIIYFEEGYFSREEAKEIITNFIDILDDNIQKNPDLRGKLILDYARDTNQELKKHIEESRIYLKSFLTLNEFFSRSLESTNLLNHKYHFVGRSNILSQLDSFLESDKKIALLPGRGGIGKSRILFEFGKSFESKHNEWELRYVSENPLTGDSIRELPEKKCIIVVDDAHRREDIITLLETAQQADVIIKSPIKIILAFRPHGRNYIKNSCNRCGFDTREIEEISEVGELERKEKEELGKSILGSKHHQYLEPLIKVAKDSTIVLVLGAQLIAEDNVQPALLEQDQEFQETVFRRFKEDIISGVISEDLDATFCRDLLSIISILSPIREENEFIERVAKYLQVKKSKLKGAIDTLKRSKVLHPVGSKLRITPDVLSDHILHNSCITSDGCSTGYSQEVFEAFGDVYLKNILENLSELDWRVTRQNRETDLLVETWENIDEQFKNSSNLDRAILLGNLDKVAYFQPQRTVSLIKYAISNPLNKSESDCTQLYEFTHEDVLGKIPPLLKNVSYNFEYLLQSCEILWGLAEKEMEIKHQSNDLNGALKVLVDLAKYEMYKPLGYNSQILSFVEKKIKNCKDPKYTCSLLDILDPILEKEILSNKLVGYEIKFIPWSIPYENTKEIRRKAIWLIENQLKSESTKVVLKALKIHSETLNPPTGYFGRKVSTEEIIRWLPEQMEILKIIEDFSKITIDPIVKIQIKSSLTWHARQTNQSEVADKASSIIKSLPEDFDTKLMRAIWYHYDRDYEDLEKNKEQIFQEIAREFLDRCNNEGKQVFNSLNETITKFQISEITICPANFLVALSTTDHKIACEVCNHIVSDTSKPLANYLEFLLSGIRGKDENTAIRLTEIAINSDDLILCRSVAEGYANRGWALRLKNEEIKIIKKLLSSLDIDTRRLAIESLGHFPDTQKNKALEIALSIEIGDNEKLADAYCSIFDEHRISPVDLNTEQLKLILKKVSQIKIFDENLCYLETFLTYCSTRIPEELVDFLLERIDLDKKVKYSSVDRFQPLPYKNFFDKGLNGISLSPHYKEILRKVRDQSLDPMDEDSSWLARLYYYISEDFSLDSLEVLSEWIDIGDEEKIRVVGTLVKEAPSDFVFSHSDFVSNLLTNAQEISDDCYKEVRSDLLESVESEGRSGFVGEPSYEDQKVRNRAQEFIEMYPIGSTTWNFYKWLSERAKRSIKDSLERDEETTED
ncbi:ATP-binding protein [Methanosarcina acetivorans]|nr:ATP-binding protein [Methanosarcina acetivorans]